MNTFDLVILAINLALVAASWALLRRARKLTNDAHRRYQLARASQDGAEKLLLQARAIAMAKPVPVVEIGKSQWPMSTNN